MTAYLVSIGSGLVFAAPDRTAAQLRWDDVTDYSISEDEPAGDAIVMTYAGED